MKKKTIKLCWLFSLVIVYGSRFVTVAASTTSPPSVTGCVSPALTNGLVQLSNGTSAGSVATFICDSNYYINGICEQNTTSSCLINGSWTDPTPSCISIVFPESVHLEAKKNGVSVENSNPSFPVQLKLGDILDLICTAQIGNNPNVTISWKASSAFSDGLLLPGAPPGQASQVAAGNFSDCQYTRIATIKHAVDTTDLSTGNISYTCHVQVATPDRQASKNVEADQVVHVEIYSKCPRPPPPEHGSISITGTAVASEAFLSCEQGYKRSTGFAACVFSGTWDTPLICNPIDCGNETAPINGAIIYKNSTLFKDTVEIICNEGFYMNGSTSSVCQANGNWSNTDSRCILTGCTKLPPLSNGNIELSNSSNINSTASFSCTYGYNLVGNSIATCGDNGWDTPLPSCKAIDCISPGAPVNGYISTITGYTVNSTAVMSCDEGYNLTGNGTIRCEENATWSAFTAVCSQIECSMNLLFAHGGLNISSTSMYVNDTAPVACDLGYVLDGSSTVTCIENGTWDTSSSKCIPKNCTYPLAPDNGYISSTTGLTMSSIAIVSCNEGYNLTGSGIIQCTEKATWSSMSAVCNLIECTEQSMAYGWLNISSSDSYVNGSAAVICDPGYTLEGSSTATCIQNGTWDTSSTRCVAKNCTNAPLPPKDGYVISITGLRVNSTAVLACNSGYDLTGDNMTQCTYNETWSPVSTLCSLIECSALSLLDHGMLNISNGQRYVNDTATVVCNPGYIPEGSQTAVCTEDGRWDTSLTNCLPRNCSIPVHPVNGIVHVTDGLAVNSTAVVTCGEGFDLIGESVITCLENGSWSDTNGTCDIKECPSPFGLGNGYFSLDNGKAEVNDTITYSCFAGYKLVGTAKTECTINATWQDDVPSCVVKNCISPGAPVNGYISTITGYTVNSTAVMSCNEGYNLSGNGTIRCEENATWSAFTAVCSQIECSMNLLFAHGGLNISANIYVNDTAPVACDLGYVLDGSSTVTCIENGTWDTSSSKCIPENCTYPLAPDNGYISFTTGLIVSSTAIISCNEGYNLTGSGIIQCTENATWSSMSAVCNLIECTEQSMAYGWLNISSSDSHVNGSAAVICDPGYTLEGSSTATCIQNGTWDTSSTRCVAKNCTNAPLPPKDGYVISITGLRVNSTAVLACNSGYDLTGDNMTQCTYNETWSPVSTLCSLIECSALSLLDHGMLNISNGQKYVNDTATVVCNPGYIPEGSQTAVCTEDGRWDTSLTNCLPRNCSIPVHPVNGIVHVTDGLAVNSTAVVTCGEGFDLIGESVITCLENGSWSDTNGTCDIKECKNPQAPRNGSVTTSAGNIYNSTAFFECDIGYYLHGINNVSCLSDGNWSFEEPFCLPINCSKLLHPDHGTLKLSNKNLFQSVGRFYCNEGYNLDGFNETECLSSSNWSNPTPSCMPVDCGNWTYANVTWTEFSYVTYSPDTLFGSTAISFCKPGFQVNSAMQSIAATCTSNGTWSKASPPLCINVECTEQSMAYGWLNISSSDSYVNGSAAVICDPGYTLEGSSTATCIQNGTWDTSSTRCVAKNCTNAPLPPKDGYVVSITGLRVNSTAVLACNSGYDLTGDNMTQCTYNETWSPVTTLCSLIECSALSLLDNGILNISSGQRYVNDTATVVCNPGYIPEGSQTAVCTEDGSWDTSLTNCVPRNCSLPVDPVNGIVHVTDGLAVNSTAVVACGEGFDLIGDSVITCLENGNWSDTNATCAIKECKNPQAPRNGSVTTSAGNIYNSTAFFECDIGYYLQGINNVTCLSDGNWSFEAPLCLPINCSTLQHPDHGTLKLSNKNSYRSAGQFYCNEGYSLDGFNATACLSSGNWSYPTPSCMAVDCGNWTYANVTWTEFSYVTYSPDTLFGSTAICFCKPGFQVNSTMQSIAATCTSNGTWGIASPPLCFNVECPSISVPENQNITLKYSNGLKVNSTATFTCTDPESQIYGFAKVTCLQSGEWTGSSPTCIKIEKDILPCPEEKDYRGTRWNKTRPGMISTKECSNPETYIGEVSRQCTVNGTWKLPVYNCVRQEIDNVNKQIEAIKDNPSEEVVTQALDKLNDITKPTEKEGSLYSGEIEKVTSILDSIANISTKTDVTHNQAEAFLETTSNLLDTSNTESWTAISQEPEDADKTAQQAKGASKILDVVSRYSDAVTRSLNNSRNTSQTVSVKNLVLHVTKVNENSDGVRFPEKSKDYNLKSSFHLPKESLKGLKHVSSVLYKNLTGILSSKTISHGQVKKDQEINSEVVAIKVEKWQQNKDNFKITLTLGHFPGRYRDGQCSFWNTDKTAWDGEGCKLNTTASSSSKSECVCNHLTNFAILMSPWEEENVDTKAIDIISTTGCSISLVALVITIIFHIALWRYVKSDRVVILINLSIALVISYAIFLGGVDRTENKDACTAVAALLQYIYLVVFFLMLAEGIEISVTVLYVFTTPSRIKWLLPAAWLIPAVIVGISLGATQLKGYGNEQFYSLLLADLLSWIDCWLSVQGGLIWAFVAPAFIIIVVNFVLLILILRAAFTSSTLAQKSKTEKTKAGVKCLCVLLPLMGCTWVIGIFYVNKQMAWIQYVFAVCNSLQGLVIFLFHCALNKQIRVAIERRRKKYNASSFLSTASSTKPFSMPRASTSSGSGHMERSRSISRDDVSNRSMSNSERNSTKRNNFELERL